MISRSRSLPRLPSSVPPSPQRLARSQSFSGAIQGSPVQPSAPTDATATEPAITVPAHPQQPAVVFDVGSLPAELQQLISSLIRNPHEACTLEQLQEALQAVKVASGVNKSFHQGALPCLHAAFLRLFGLGRIKGASFDSLPLQELPPILEGIVARSGLSGLQCLSDLVNGSLGEHPDLARQAFVHWIQMAKKAMATGLPYHLLPTLIAVRLGQMLRRGGVSPTHALMLMRQLLGSAQAGSLPRGLAMPALIEVALLVQAQEIVWGTSFRARPPGRGLQWVELGSTDVQDVMEALGSWTADLQKALLAVAWVLATRRAPMGKPSTKAVVLTALKYLADCPYPLIGSLAEALDIIQRMDLGQDPQVEDLLARCAAKRASVRLLGPSPQ